MSIVPPIAQLGTDIEFWLQPKYDNGEHQSIDDMIDVTCYAYTSSLDIKKFSKTDRTAEDYVQLEKITSYLYKGVIESDVSALMNKGYLILEVRFDETDASRTDGLKSTQFRAVIYNLKDNQIKSEQS